MIKYKSNLVDINQFSTASRRPDLQFEVSTRHISPAFNAVDYLKINYIYLAIEQIKSVFGNTVYPSRFYGGRSYQLERSLTDAHLEQLEQQGIHLTLTLTGLYFDKKVYQANLPFLQRLYKPGNAIVCANDELAVRLRQDFPDFLLKASLVKNLDTLAKVNKALHLYDRVVIPMNCNDDDAFLSSLPDKSRIVLFANANCAYNCPARTCYRAISRASWGKEKKGGCSKKKIPRKDEGTVFFNVEKLAKMGFHHFKMVPHLGEAARHSLEYMSSRRRKVKPQSADEQLIPQPDLIVRSYPKCGRTWLRILLANYLNHFFDLEIPVNLQTLFTLLPNDLSGLKGPEQFQFAHVKGVPRVLWSHQLPKNDRNRKSPWLLLVRGFPDVVVSDYFQNIHLSGGFCGSLTEFIHSDKGAVHRYCRFLNSWTAAGIPTPEDILSYEQLHRDTVNSLSQLLTITGLPTDTAMLTQAVSSSSFANMRAIENEHGIPVARSGDTTAEGRRVRKGKIGGYVDYLDEESIVYIRTQATGLLSPKGLNLTKKWDLLPGDE